MCMRVQIPHSSLMAASTFKQSRFENSVKTCKPQQSRARRLHTLQCAHHSVVRSASQQQQQHRGSCVAADVEAGRGQRCLHVTYRHLAPATAAAAAAAVTIEAGRVGHRGRRVCACRGSSPPPPLLPPPRLWKMPAASAASQPVRRKAVSKCAGAPAPLDAMSGMRTAARSEAVSSSSKPRFWPSLSMQFASSSPAPRAWRRRAQTAGGVATGGSDEGRA